MRDPSEGGSGNRSCTSRCGTSFPMLCRVAFIAILLLVTAAEREQDGGVGPRHRPRRPPSPRKVSGPFHSPTHVPLPRGRSKADKDGDPKSLYEDDMRIVHTGPNPLHN
ncbi:hypothetical protein MLD38_011380 [Melastoma candidum]|uniref:Uncharacterized protein n=1 Tax=Melastoma candidum TaxID=119954 RepID=A0ACB9R2A6_9MYRT|nr:hypothetical protein MLD38_011380 [Melastoma candidum]